MKLEKRTFKYFESFTCQPTMTVSVMLALTLSLACSTSIAQNVKQLKNKVQPKPSTATVTASTTTAEQPTQPLQPLVATVARNVDLKAQPFSDAETLMSLAENQKINVLSRKASWMEVRAQDMQGWVKMLSLRFEGKVDAPAGNGLGDTAKSFFSLMKGSSGESTTTTGARGWTKESFGNLSPNPDAFEKMKLFSVMKQDAASFAKQEKLNEQEMPYLKTQGEK